MDKALFAFLQKLLDIRRIQLGKLTPEIAAASQACCNCLMNDGQIFSFGSGDGLLMAKLFERQLLDIYRIDRPNLPCMALDERPGHDGEALALKQLRAFAKPEDCVIIFASADIDVTIEPLMQIAADRGLKNILICPEDAASLKSALHDNDLDISIDVAHKAHLLDSQIAVAMAVSGLIDFQLFGSEL